MMIFADRMLCDKAMGWLSKNHCDPQFCDGGLVVTTDTDWVPVLWPKVVEFGRALLQDAGLDLVVRWEASLDRSQAMPLTESWNADELIESLGWTRVMCWDEVENPPRTVHATPDAARSEANRREVASGEPWLVERLETKAVGVTFVGWVALKGHEHKAVRQDGWPQFCGQCGRFVEATA